MQVTIVRAQLAQDLDPIGRMVQQVLFRIHTSSSLMEAKDNRQEYAMTVEPIQFGVTPSCSQWLMTKIWNLPSGIRTL